MDLVNDICSVLFPSSSDDVDEVLIASYSSDVGGDLIITSIPLSLANFNNSGVA
jgi:hypothetical protein